MGVGHCKTAQIQDQLPLNQSPSRGRDLVRGADLARFPRVTSLAVEVQNGKNSLAGHRV